MEKSMENEMKRLFGGLGLGMDPAPTHKLSTYGRHI